MLAGTVSRRESTPGANTVESHLGPGRLPAEEDLHVRGVDVFYAPALDTDEVVVRADVRVVPDLARRHPHDADQAELLEQRERVVHGRPAGRGVVPRDRGQHVVRGRVRRGRAQVPGDRATRRSPCVTAFADAGFESREVGLVHGGSFQRGRVDVKDAVDADGRGLSTWTSSDALPGVFSLPGAYRFRRGV